MSRPTLVLAILLLALAAYELVAVATNTYPTITESVAALPAWAAGAVVIGLLGLAVHFVRAWDRRRD